jgi:hypothetical protein
VEEEGRDRSGLQKKVARRVSRSRFLALSQGSVPVSVLNRSM